MKKISIMVCAVFFILIGQGWGTEITMDFHGEIGLYETRVGSTIYPLKFVGDLTYNDADFSVTNIEITKMYSNDQRVYGGHIGKGSSESLTVMDGEIVGIKAIFETHDYYHYSDPNGDYQEWYYPQDWFDLQLHPPGDELVAYRDPPDGLYDGYEKRYLDDYDIYAKQGTAYGGIIYSVNERVATISDTSDLLGYKPETWGGTVSGWGTYDFGPVPEPTTILLFGAGIVGLAGFGRKKFKK